jgi:glycosyltransferase involved in cell wall biosynthesis
MRDSRKKILLIAYHFPPIGGSAAIRPLKISKHISAYGWNPIILTAKNPDWYYAHDPDLLKELDTNSQIIKSYALHSSWVYRILNPFRMKKLDRLISSCLIMPDDYIGWLPWAYVSGLAAIKKYDPQIIYSTSGPMTCHLVAQLLKRKTGLKWIAEFRDEWLEDPSLSLPTRFHRSFHHWVEGRVVKNADRIITMAPAVNKLLSKHLNTADKFETIPAGFDPEDRANHLNKECTRRESGKFTLTFTGLFYDSFRPISLLTALSELISEGKIPKESLAVKFVGANTRRQLNGADRYGISEFTGFQPRTEALKQAFVADALLLLLSQERGRHVIPSKIFEYLASGKPILALIPENGEVAKLLKETDSGLIVDFNDVPGIKSTFYKLFCAWQQGRINSYIPDMKKVEQYNQIKLFERMAGTFDEVIRM